MAVSKVIFLLNVLCFCSIFALTEIENAIISIYTNDDNLNDSLLKLKDAKPEDLPLSLRKLVRRTAFGEHMCCRNRPVGFITKTRSAKRVTNVKEEYKVSSGSCGLFGTGTCNKYDYKYHEVITYVTEYFKDINYLDCPDRHVVCCNYYIMVSQKCVLMTSGKYFCQCVRRVDSGRPFQRNYVFGNDDG